MIRILMKTGNVKSLMPNPISNMKVTNVAAEYIIYLVVEENRLMIVLLAQFLASIYTTKVPVMTVHPSRKVDTCFSSTAFTMKQKIVAGINVAKEIFAL